MKQKDLAQRILAMYNSLNSNQEKKQFVQLLKDILNIIETMSKDDFADFVDNFEKHLNQIDDMKRDFGIDDKN
jgi:hypothetical protein